MKKRKLRRQSKKSRQILVILLNRMASHLRNILSSDYNNDYNNDYSL